MLLHLHQVGSALNRARGAGTRQVTAMVGKGRFFVGGNWKCNETTAEVKKLVEELNAGSVPDDIEIIVAPTYIHLQMVRPHRSYAQLALTMHLNGAYDCQTCIRATACGVCTFLVQVSAFCLTMSTEWADDML